MITPAFNVLYSIYPAILTICVFIFMCFCSYFVPTCQDSNAKILFVNKKVCLLLCYSGPPILLMYCKKAISHMLGVLAGADTIK